MGACACLAFPLAIPSHQARHIQQAEDMVIELEGGRGLQNRLHEEGMTPIHCHNNFVVANVQGGKLDVFEIDFLAHW